MENIKKIISMVLLLFMFGGVFAITQNELINYQFEENGGNVIIDVSGNNIHGSNTGCSWTQNEKFGSYALDFDGDKDYVTISNAQQIPRELSVSFWFYPLTNQDDILVNIYDTTDLLQIWTDSDGGNDNLYLKYKDTSGAINQLNIDSTNFNQEYNHIVLLFDFENNNLTYYWDNNLISSFTLLNVSRESETNMLRLGANIEPTQNEFDGYIDSFRLFDFILNETQITDLNSNNHINLIVDSEENETNISNTITTKIINYVNPQNNGVVSNQDLIEANLLHSANCELYIDNDLKDTWVNVLGFVYPLLELQNGDYDYFVYCEYINNGTKIYELSNITHFTIVKPSRAIEFYLYDKNNNLLNDYDDLYLTTPCFTDKEMSKYYTPDKKAYIQHLNNGMATFNLSYSGSYDFCLLHGKLNSIEDKFSLKYDLVDIDKQTELGELFVNNNTYTYSLKIDDTDLYKVTAPEFWGKTWASLFQLIVGVLLGGLIILIGLMAGVDKLIIVGGLIIAIGMGVSITTFVGAIV